MAINNADKKAAREATLQDLLDSFAGGGSADNAPVVAQLTAILTELQGVLDVDGTVELGSTTVTNLQSAFTTSLATTNTDLQAIAGNLNDIYAELLQKFEAGQDIGLSTDTMDALGTAIATLFHYPTDYPNAQAHTDAASILAAVTQTNYLLDDTTYSGTITAADSGSTSTAVSSGDTIVTGTPTANSYVSFTLTKDATAQVTLTPSTFSIANVVFEVSNDGSTWFRTSLMLHDGTRITSAASGASGHVSVTGYSYFRARATQYTGGNPITVNVVESARPAVVRDTRTAEILAAVSQSNVKLDSVYTRLGAVTIANAVTINGMTDGTQLAKITNGTQIADTAAGDSGQNMLLTGVARKEVTFSTASPAALISGDYSAYSYAVIQVTSGSSYTCTFQTSNDNSTWVGAQNWNLASNLSLPSIAGSNSTVGVFIVPLIGRYFRINATAVGATFAGTVEFWSGKTIPPMLLAVTGPAAGNLNTNSIQSGTWSVFSGGPVPTTSLSAVTATGAGTAVNLGAVSKSQTLQVTVAGTGALSALTVLLEGSLDGANWVTLATYTGTSGTGNVYSVNQPVSRIRANCTVRTASSGTPTITAIVGAAV